MSVKDTVLIRQLSVGKLCPWTGISNILTGVGCVCMKVKLVGLGKGGMGTVSESTVNPIKLIGTATAVAMIAIIASVGTGFDTVIVVVIVVVVVVAMVIKLVALSVTVTVTGHTGPYCLNNSGNRIFDWEIEPSISGIRSLTFCSAKFVSRSFSFLDTSFPLTE